MHIILSTVGSAGDVHPVIGLGLALKERGHQTTLITNPYFQTLIESEGLPFLPLGEAEDYLRMVNNPDLWHPQKAFEVVAKGGLLPATGELYQHLTAFDPANTLVVTSGLAFGARLAQEKLGFRMVTAHLQASMFMSAHDPAEMGGVRLPEWLPLGFRRGYLSFIEEKFVDAVVMPELNAIRAGLGLPPASHLFSRWMHSPDLVLGMFPAWYAPPQPDWPQNTHLPGFIEYKTGDQTLSPDVAAFLEAGDPPVVFTPGSAMRHGTKFFRAALDACQTLGCRAILLTRYRDHLPRTLPEGALHAEWVPMGTLLPRVAALVHHGGIGTTAQALAAGIPHLIMPLAHDQPDNANRIKALGVGDRLNPRQFNARNLTKKLDYLLHDAQVQANCKAYARKVDFEQALQKTCEMIETQAAK